MKLCFEFIRVQRRHLPFFSYGTNTLSWRVQNSRLVLSHRDNKNRHLREWNLRQTVCPYNGYIVHQAVSTQQPSLKGNSFCLSWCCLDVSVQNLALWNTAWVNCTSLHPVVSQVVTWHLMQQGDAMWHCPILGGSFLCSSTGTWRKLLSLELSPPNSQIHWWVSCVKKTKGRTMATQ